MTRRTCFTLLALSASLAACSDDGNTGPGQPDLAAAADLAAPTLGFFITSEVGSANLGGLAGADQRCQRLAAAVGHGGKTWAAYLSADASGADPAVNARDRIGQGPWYNVAGVKIADNIDELHKTTVNLTKATALDEKGQAVLGRGDMPNEHDILTGSLADGRLSAGATCANWTSEAATGVGATVGHHDRMGLDTSEPAMSWNSSHASRGCSLAALRMTGGAGRFYCFAK
jgi:hypothetical protein